MIPAAAPVHARRIVMTRTPTSSTAETTIDVVIQAADGWANMLWIPVSPASASGTSEYAKSRTGSCALAVPVLT